MVLLFTVEDVFFILIHNPYSELVKEKEVFLEYAGN